MESAEFSLVVIMQTGALFLAHVWWQSKRGVLR
jgi:hypothetical protein